jgi:hypothetical protein
MQENQTFVKKSEIFLDLRETQDFAEDQNLFGGFDI